MSDIFLSYVIYDTDKAHKLAALFRQQGWTVWLSPPTLPPGADYDRSADREFKVAKVIVALWSSTASVLSTVQEDLKHVGGPLSTIVLLDKTEPPTERNTGYIFDLSDWDGAESDVWLRSLLDTLRIIIGTSPPAAEPHDSPTNAPRIDTGEPSRQTVGQGFKGVFISYRRNEGAAYAGRLYDRLSARFGRERVFLDVENVGWGEDFVEAITSAAESCAVMIALISPRWSRGTGAEIDDYVRLEVAKALGRKIRVIPILIQGATMPAPKDLPEDLAPLVRRNALALSDTRWERDVEDLIKSLESLLND